jgi:hypothetical protein
VDKIFSKPMPEFDDDSIIDLIDKTEKDGLDFSMYVGFTERRIVEEAFEFLGRRSANRPRKRDGKKPRQRPVLLRGDNTLPEKKRHFTAKRCRDELSMKHVFFSSSSMRASWRTRCRAGCSATPWASDCGGRWPRAKRRRTQEAEKGRGVQGLHDLWLWRARRHQGGRVLREPLGT